MFLLASAVILLIGFWWVSEALREIADSLNEWNAVTWQEEEDEK